MSGECPGSKHMTRFAVPDSKNNSSEDELSVVNVNKNQHATVRSENNNPARRLTHTASSNLAKKTRSTPGQEEKRLLGDFDVPQDATPIVIPSNYPPTDRMKTALQGGFKPCNTLTHGPNAISSFRTAKLPITYTTRGEKKRSHPQSVMSANLGRPDKPFDLHSEDVDERRNKRPKQSRASETLDPIEVSSGTSDKSDNGDAVSRIIPNRSSSAFAPQTGKIKNASRTGGLGTGVDEFQKVEDALKVSRAKPSAPARVIRDQRRNTNPPSDLGAEEISSTTTTSSRPLEAQQGILGLGMSERERKRSDDDEYRGTANQRISRKQREKQQGAMNGRTRRPTVTKPRVQTPSPYFLPKQDGSTSKPADSGMKGNDVTSGEQEVTLLSSGNGDMRQQIGVAAPERVVLDSPDAVYKVEPLRVSSRLAQKTGRARPLDSVNDFNTSGADDLVMVGARDALKRGGSSADKPEIDSSTPDSVATVGNITPTTFTNSGNKGVAVTKAKNNSNASPNPICPYLRIKSLFHNRSPVPFTVQSDEHTEYLVTIDRISRDVILLKRDSTTNQEEEQPVESLSKIFKLDYSSSILQPSFPIILSKRNTPEEMESRIWIDFREHDDRRDFLRSVGGLESGIRQHHTRPDSYMANALQNMQRIHGDRPSLSSQVRKDKNRLADLFRDIEDRKGVSDGCRSPQLQNPRNGLEEDEMDDSRPHRSGANEESVPTTRQRSSLQKPKKEPIVYENSHMTRSRNRQLNASNEQHSDTDIAKPAVPEIKKYSKTVGLPKEWALPLVYPLEGPRKANVDWIDLERLDEGEFLNDNLISFYLRLLEHKLEESDKGTAQKVYIFNTFFYARLTSGGHGHKSFNFEAVAKWTSKIDIFSYDYVVVPINENAHWYLAIICNLPKLVERKTRDDSQTSSADLDQETSERPKPDQTSLVQDDGGESMEFDMAEKDESLTSPAPMDVDEPTNPAATETGPESNLNKVNHEGMAEVLDTEGVSRESSLTAKEIALQESPVELGSPKIPYVSDKEIDAVPTETKGAEEDSKKVMSSQRRKKKTAPSPKKYNVDGPVIITLDSLGLPHSATIKNLKQYLAEEARSKRQLEIDVKDISGMTAKQIPEQDNFCDCGLFLLGYMEKFLQNPRELVNNILQRNLDVEKDWPDMRPTKMRNNIRDILIKMGEEQEQARKLAHKEEAKRRGKYHGTEKVRDTKPQQSTKDSVAAVTSKALAKSDDIKVPESKDKGEGGGAVKETVTKPNLTTEDSVILIPRQSQEDDEALPSGDVPHSTVEVVITKSSTY